MRWRVRSVRDLGNLCESCASVGPQVGGAGGFPGDQAEPTQVVSTLEHSVFLIFVCFSYNRNTGMEKNSFTDLQKSLDFLF